MEFNNRIYRDIGDNLIMIRNEYKCSREQMAHRLGLSRSSYYKNETCISSPSIKTLFKLAMDHNISMDWFFFRKGAMHYDEKEKTRELEELKQQLAQEQKKTLELEQEKQKEKEADLAEIKPEIKELLTDMAAVPLLYHEILVHYQRFKVENKALMENSRE